MEPITSGLLTNLLAAGLLNRVEAGRQHLHAVFREAEFHAELDAIETEFHKSLCDAIEDGAAEQELDDFADIVEHWDAVIEHLDATAAMDGEDGPATDRMVFESEREAVDRLAREIGAVCGYDLETNPQLQQALKSAVAEAYREAVGSFSERLVDAGLDEQFVAEANIEELGALDQLQDRLSDLEERLTHPRFYELYRGDAAGRRRASRMIDPQALEFVSRPELEDNRTAQRLLVLGPGGSGKSRVLAELVATADSAIEHIIRPKAALQSPQDLQPLRSESFQGDVLLVWDDLHAISPETDNTVFRKAIFELEEFLAPDHELHVLAAARSDQVESLPGDISTDSSLWSPFEDVWLEELESEAIATLFDRVLAKEGVMAADEVRTAFVEKAQATDPSPLYITSVVETVDGVQLTTADIEVLPEDALTIWQEQYKAIKAANDNRRFVLWAVKLFAELGGLPAYPHSLLKGIYAHVLDRDEPTFGPPVEELCQRRWLVPRVNVKGETRYVVHDVKAEAIDESLDGRLRAYSTFLCEAVDRYLPATGGIEHMLHENYAGRLYNRSLIWDTQVLEQHCGRALTLDSECATAHTTYANVLSGPLDDPETAKEHHERALAIDPEDATAHYNYANLLEDEYDAVEEAKEHYEQALALDPEFTTAHTNYANLLEDEYDAMETAKEHRERALALDPGDATAHYNYANLLADEDDAIEEAKEHYEEALGLDPGDATAHYNYANLLRNEYDAMEEAKEHHERALAIDPEDATVHYNYANLLRNEYDAMDEAKKHYEQALALDPEFTTAHTNYANLLDEEYDAIDEAKKHYEKALAIDPKDATAHYNYANLLEDEYDAIEEAKEHYEQALAIDPEDAQTHTNYAILLGFYFDRVEEAQRHFEQALTINPDLGPANNNYAVLLYQELDAPEQAQRYFERGIANYDDPMAHYHYGELLFKEFDSPTEAKPHFEIAHQVWHESDAIERELTALHGLVRVCRALDDEATALEHCEYALELPIDDPDNACWFESAHALLTEDDYRTAYTNGLMAVLDEKHDLANGLFELVWTTRDKQSLDSDSYNMTLSAGVALAALANHDVDSTYTCEEILTDIDPILPSSPINVMYKSLDGRTIPSLDVSPTDDSPGEHSFEMLERQAVAHLLN